jgi:hypothetical protein
MDIEKIRRDINGRLLSAHWNKRAVRPLNALLAVVDICDEAIKEGPTFYISPTALRDAIARELGVGDG